MRVLHVTSGLGGDAGQALIDLALAQHRVGHQVTIAANAADAAQGRTGRAIELSLAGIPTYWVGDLTAHDVRRLARAAVQLRDLLAPRQLDVVHAHAVAPAVAARLALGDRHGVPVVQTVHGWGPRARAAASTDAVAALNLADAAVTSSATMRDSLWGAGLTQAPVSVVPCGLPALPADTPDAKARPDTATPTAASASWTTPARASDGAVHHVRCLGTPAGEGSALLGEALGTGLLDQVRLHGGPEGGWRRAPLSPCDALVMTGCDDDSAYTVVGALRAGLPLVVPDEPEILELVDADTAYVFQARSAESLAAALARALGEPRVEAAGRRERMRRRFAAAFSLDVVSAGYARVYDDARAERTRRQATVPALMAAR